MGTTTTSRLDAFLTGLISMDLPLGSDLLHSRAEDAFTLCITLIADAAYCEKVGTELHRLAAKAAGFAGWMAFNNGNHPIAESRYQTAIHLAEMSGAVDLKTYYTMDFAHQQSAIGRPVMALELLSTVASDVRRGRTSARTAAAVHAISAEAHAILGDSAAHTKAIEAARAALEHDTTPQTFTPNSWVTAPVIELEAGYSLLRLGKPRQALPHFEVLNNGAFPSEQWPREAAIHLVYAAKARLGAGDVEAAVAYARRAHDFLDRVSSTRASQRVACLRRALSVHQRTPAVRDYLDRPMT
ncbi:hypothetical protein AB0C81_18395 [Streptomyces roseoverticillatus]|uniref:hypothetical protein n=1 Tax=Streptomyces roseoverticillatus TaxID=66429 RepID=UPI0033CE873D